MIFETKELFEIPNQSPPACPMNGRPCLMGGCAVFEWYIPVDGKEHDHDFGYCGLSRGMSFANGAPNMRARVFP